MLQGMPRHPRYEDAITFANVRHLTAGSNDRARRLMPEQRGHRLARPVQLVQLRMADAGGEQPHEHLLRSRIAQLYLIDDERFAMFGEDRSPRTHRSSLQRAVIVPASRAGGSIPLRGSVLSRLSTSQTPAVAAHPACALVRAGSRSPSVNRFVRLHNGDGAA